MEATINLYRQMGILTGCKSVGICREPGSKVWEVWGHFQNADGRRNGRVAQFDSAADAVAFKVAFEQGRFN